MCRSSRNIPPSWYSINKRIEQGAAITGTSRGYRSARRQNTAEDHRSPPQRVLRVRGDPAGVTTWFPTEPFHDRYDIRDSSATGVGVEETNSVVCMIYRPYQSIRLR